MRPYCTTKMDVSATDLTKLYVSDAGQTNEVSLDGATLDTTSDSATMLMTLAPTHTNRIVPMDTPQLDIMAGAVSGLTGSFLNDVADNPIMIITDSIKPSIVSTTLDKDTSVMTIAFDAPINVSDTDLSMLYVHGEDQSSRVFLSGASLDRTVSDRTSISIALTAPQLSAIISMDNPRLDISAGAITDFAGNAISTMSSDPIVLTGSLLSTQNGNNNAATATQSRTTISGGGGSSGSGGGSGGEAGGSVASDESVGLYSVMWDCNEQTTSIILDSSRTAEITLLANSESFTPATDPVQNLDGRTIYTVDAYASMMLLKVNAGEGNSVTKTINTLDSCIGQIEYARYVPGISTQTLAQPVPEPQQLARSSFVQVQASVAEPASVLEQIPVTEPAIEEESEPDCEQGMILQDGECVERTPAPDAENGGCLIATAAYGSELASRVQMLRELRDSTLLSTASGASFVSQFNSVYYTFSPTIADLERTNPAFRETTRALITPMIYTMSIMSLTDDHTEGSVLMLGTLVIALNLGMYVAAPVTLGIVITRRFRVWKNLIRVPR